MSAAAKKARGRPRTKVNTELIDSLIGRQDAMSRRVFDKIEEIRRTHVSTAYVDTFWRSICREARREFEALPDRAVARVPNLGPAGRAFLAQQVAATLEEMGCPNDDGAPLRLPPEEKWPRAVQDSTSLAAARAQLARLQTFWITLRARIVRDYHLPGREKE